MSISLRDQLVTDLQKHINKLEKFRFYLRSSHLKMTILKNLQQEIQKAPLDNNKDVFAMIIGNFLNKKIHCLKNNRPAWVKHKKILAMHRNIFQAEIRPNKTTGTQDWFRNTLTHLEKPEEATDILLNLKNLRTELHSIHSSLISFDSITPLSYAIIKKINFFTSEKILEKRSGFTLMTTSELKALNEILTLFENFKTVLKNTENIPELSLELIDKANFYHWLLSDATKWQAWETNSEHHSDMATEYLFRKAYKIHVQNIDVNGDYPSALDEAQLLPLDVCVYYMRKASKLGHHGATKYLERLPDYRAKMSIKTESKL